MKRAHAFPQTLYEPVKLKAKANPNGVCFHSETANGWRAHTHGEFQADIIAAASALWHQGVRKGDCIGLLGPPSYEWEVADKAIMYLGAISVGLDSNATSETLAEVIEEAGIRALFVEDAAQLERIDQRARHRLAFIVLFQEGASLQHSAAALQVNWSEFCTSGEGRETPKEEIRPEGIGAIIFTSGTTGRPKGIPLRHRQLATGFPLMDEIFEGETNHTTLTWVPFYNITGRMMEANNYYMEVEQYFVKDPKTLLDKCKQVNPSYLVVLPRILEKVSQGIHAKLATQPAHLRVAFRLIMALRTAAQLSSIWSVTDKILIRKVRHAVWGTRLKFLISGSAPVDPNVLKFFDALGVPTLEVYGMSESGFLLTMNRPGRMRYGSVGEPLAHVKLKIADDGEVLVKSKATLEHYWGDKDTSALYDSEGFMKTGDLGRLDNGYLYLQGRKKEIIKTSTGLRIAPVAVEQAYQDIPGIENVVAIGNNRKFVVGLMALEVDFRAKLEAENRDPKAYLCEEVKQRNGRLRANEQIKKLALLPAPLCIEAGEITPTLKLRREAIEKKYQELIDGLYADGDSI